MASRTVFLDASYSVGEVRLARQPLARLKRSAADLSAQPVSDLLVLGMSQLSLSSPGWLPENFLFQIVSNTGLIGMSQCG